jgi:DNA-binding NarL/FixJ family response regulator
MKARFKFTDDDPSRQEPNLRNREIEIIQLVIEGHQNKEIGEKLHLTEQTVKDHLHRIFGKLGVSDRSELILYVLHQRLRKDASMPGS